MANPSPGMDLLTGAETFVRIVEAGSLSGAARSLRVSLPVVSRHLAALERQLGVALVARTTRRLQVTEAGARFLDHARRLVQGASEARASVDPRAALAGRLVVSTSVTLGTLRVVPFLPAFLRRHPGVEAELRLEDRLAELVGEGVDVVVRAGVELPDSASVVAQRVASFRQLLVAAPSYLRATSRPRTLAALPGHVAVRGLGASSAWRFGTASGERAVTLPTALRVGTLLGIAAAAEAGLGLAVLPEFVVEASVAARRLSVLEVGATLPAVTVHALYRRELRASARLQALVRHLQRTMPMGAADAGG